MQAQPSARVYAMTMDGAEASTPLDRELSTSTAAIRARMLVMEALPRLPLPAAYMLRRRDLVELICSAGQECKLDPTTAHVAVGYMDKAAASEEGRTFLQDSRWIIVPAACLMLAAKWEEKTYESDYEKLPSVQLMSEIILKWHGHNLASPEAQLQLGTMVENVHHLEVEIVQAMDWCMTVITPSHYLGLYTRQGVLFSNDVVVWRPLLDLPPENRVQVFTYLQGYLSTFSEMGLQADEFTTTLPSLQAAGMVLATRKALNIRPLWNPSLSTVLGVELGTVLPVFERIWEHYRAFHPARAALSEKREQEAIEYAAKEALSAAQAAAVIAAAVVAAARATPSESTGSGFTPIKEAFGSMELASPLPMHIAVDGSELVTPTGAVVAGSRAAPMSGSTVTASGGESRLGSSGVSTLSYASGLDSSAISLRAARSAQSWATDGSVPAPLFATEDVDLTVLSTGSGGAGVRPAAAALRCDVEVSRDPELEALGGATHRSVRQRTSRDVAEQARYR